MGAQVTETGKLRCGSGGAATEAGLKQGSTGYQGWDAGTAAVKAGSGHGCGRTAGSGHGGEGGRIWSGLLANPSLV